MRIAFLCNEYPPLRNGGIGTYTKEVAERLVLFGHDVTVVGIFMDKGVDAISWQNGVRLVQLAPSKMGFPANRLKLIRAVLKVEKLWGLDILETQEYGGYLIGWPKTRFKIIVRLHGSVIYFNHELSETTWKNIPWKIAEMSTLRRADKIVSVSKYTARRTVELFNLKTDVEVIYNGVTLPEKQISNGKMGSKFKVVFAGSLQKKKGFLSLLSAWQMVLDKVPNAELHLAGKDNSNQLKMVSELVVQSETIKYHGVLTKRTLEELYREMDLAVFPSFMEAFSLAPMEAMAVGLPVIYTSLCSGPELIDDGINGILVDPNYPVDIAKAIIKIAKLPIKSRFDLGQCGRLHIESKFSIDRLARENEDMMRKLIN